ncbi:MAG: hypothetical protein U0271_07170 [Polyangiaceae bacterium]
MLNPDEFDTLLFLDNENTAVRPIEKSLDARIEARRQRIAERRRHEKLSHAGMLAALRRG